MEEVIVSIHQLKARLSEYIGQAIHQRKRIIISRRDKPVAMLAPLDESGAPESEAGLEAVRWEDFAEIADMVDSIYTARQSEGHRALSV